MLLGTVAQPGTGPHVNCVKLFAAFKKHNPDELQIQTYHEIYKRPKGDSMQWKEFNSNYKKAAVYKICLIRNNPAGKTIPRFLGEDTEQILTIGSAVNLQRRINTFYRAIKDGKANHSEGKFLYTINQSCDLKISQNDIKVHFKPLENETIASKTEMQEIFAYIKNFGEPPVLNKAIPKKSKRS